MSKLEDNNPTQETIPNIGEFPFWREGMTAVEYEKEIMHWHKNHKKPDYKPLYEMRDKKEKM